MHAEHARMHVRLRYPDDARPRLILDDDEFEVVDLSERGVRYRQGRGPAPAVGRKLEGILCLARGETLPIRGSVVRVLRSEAGAAPGALEVAAHLTEVGIPHRVIAAERQAIGAHHAEH
ncbi:MAG TPA: hypothetical protein VFW66_06250 [Gemmatimonadales bacterium]|nr:hypothetical protein [Gemmatimonadales bacterium]